MIHALSLISLQIEKGECKLMIDAEDASYLVLLYHFRLGSRRWTYAEGCCATIAPPIAIAVVGTVAAWTNGVGGMPQEKIVGAASERTTLSLYTFRCTCSATSPRYTR